MLRPQAFGAGGRSNASALRVLVCAALTPLEHAGRSQASAPLPRQVPLRFVCAATSTCDGAAYYDLIADGGQNMDEAALAPRTFPRASTFRM